MSWLRPSAPFDSLKKGVGGERMLGERHLGKKGEDKGGENLF